MTIYYISDYPDDVDEYISDYPDDVDEYISDYPGFRGGSSQTPTHNPSLASNGWIRADPAAG